MKVPPKVNICHLANPSGPSILTKPLLILDIKTLLGANSNPVNSENKVALLKSTSVPLHSNHSSEGLNVFATPFFPLSYSRDNKSFLICDDLNPHAKCFDYKGATHIYSTSDPDTMRPGSGIVESPTL